MTAELFDTLKPEVLRDQYGRPMIVPVAGGKPVPYTRVSTFKEAFSEAGGLIKYTNRFTALGIARNEDLAAIAAGCEYGDKVLDEMIEVAQDRVGGNAKANYGTAVHRFTEADGGAHVPARMVSDVEAYQATLARHGATVLMSDRFIVNDDLQVAGTFDDILAFVAANRMSDKKTGTLHILENAIQLAAYAGGVFYDLDEDGNPVRTPLPPLDTDTAILAHIPAGKGECTFYAVDLNLGRAACELATEIRAWRKRKDLAVPLEEIAPAPPARPDNDPATVGEIALAISFCTSVERLGQIWSINQGRWTPELSELASARKKLITGGLL